MNGEPSNETLKSMIDDIRKASDERHSDYKEERKQTERMLKEISDTVNKIKDNHVETEKNLALLLDWSVEAKKVIESNSTSIGQLQKRDYMVMGAFFVLSAIGVTFVTLFIKDIVREVVTEEKQKIPNEVVRILEETYSLDIKDEK
jgi:heme exporter protein D